MERSESEVLLQRNMFWIKLGKMIRSVNSLNGSQKELYASIECIRRHKHCKFCESGESKVYVVLLILI